MLLEFSINRAMTLKNAKIDRSPKVLIALLMSAKAGQDKLAGIFRYLREGSRWNFSIFRTAHDLAACISNAQSACVFDGVIFSLPDPPEIINQIAQIDVPIVVVDILDADILRARTKDVAFVHNDAKQIGRCAAEYLMSQGVFRSYVYVGMPRGFAWSRLRQLAFCEAIERKEQCCHVFTSQSSTTRPARDGMLDGLVPWLSALPKPVGLLVACDDLARQVLELFVDVGVRVPEDVAVLGIDNEYVICENTQPPLTSIQPPFEEEGYQAARLLDEMMTNNKVQPMTVTCGVSHVFERQSTRPISHAGVLIQKALSFIQANVSSDISVDDVVRHLKVSRRLADLRFHEVCGKSIMATIRDVRLDQVAKLLDESDLPIGELASCCGYNNENSLRNQFKAKFQMSMRDYRKLDGDFSSRRAQRKKKKMES